MASIGAVSNRSDNRLSPEDLNSNKRQEALDSLSNSLVNNDLSGAQEALGQFVKLSPGIARSLSKEKGKASGSEGLPGKLSDLSEALQAGDLKAARTAFQEIQQNKKAPMVAGSNTTQVLGMGLESVGAANASPSAGTYLNTTA